VEPTLETLERRFRADGRRVSIRELCDSLGMEPSTIESRTFTGRRPFGELERLEADDRESEPWTLRPADLSAAPGERQLIQLTFEPSEPWLIAAWRTGALAIQGWRGSPMGATAGATGLTGGERSPRRFQALGSFKAGWCGWREDLPAASNPARLHGLRTLLRHASLEGAQIWKVPLPSESN
jgi:hypothetical protein